MATAFARGGAGDAGGTLTSVMRDRHQAKAAYRLLDRPEVTHETVIGGHCREVLDATASPGDYLLIEDTTAIAYPGLKQAQGLGPIGESYTRGLWAHQTLVVKVDWRQDRARLLGLLGQKVWARSTSSSSSRSKHAYGSRQARESQRWMATLQQAGGAMHGTTWTYVADRESDIYELFQSAWAQVVSVKLRTFDWQSLVDGRLVGPEGA